MGLQNPSLDAVVSPGVLEDSSERHDAARIHHQQTEDAEFERCQLHARSPAPGLVRLEIKEDIPDAELRCVRTELTVLPPEDGPHTCEELRYVKRLADEIIRSRVQPCDDPLPAVDLCEEDHRYSGRAADTTADVQPADLLEIGGEHKEIYLLAFPTRKDLLAVGRRDDRVAVASERVTQQIEMVGITLSEQDFHRACSPTT